MAFNHKKAVLPVVLTLALLSLVFLYNNINFTNLRKNSEFSSPRHHDELERTLIADTANVEHLEMTKSEWNACLDNHKKPSEYLSIVIVTRVDDYAG